MLSFLPAPIVGVIALFLYSLSLLFAPNLVILIALLKILIPIKWWQDKCTHFIHETAALWWVKTNHWVIRLTTKTQWDVQGTGTLSKDEWYLLICNHQSWLDILVLEEIFAPKVPLISFFMKKELLWTLPIAGLTCWLLGFPFMERYSKDYLKKHPEKAGKDLENTRRACEKFKTRPITIMNYLEGTRFTEIKHKKQASPFKHLLKPKAGGVAFVLASMNGQLHKIIDVTIVYPDKNANFWQFLCGRMKKIIVRYEVLPITQELLGNYYEDQAFRVKLHGWLNQLWQRKDRLIDNLLEQEKS